MRLVVDGHTRKLLGHEILLDVPPVIVVKVSDVGFFLGKKPVKRNGLTLQQLQFCRRVWNKS
jgi:hypothetical protein